jgi:hypothetical protein
VELLSSFNRIVRKIKDPTVVRLFPTDELLPES